MKLSFKKTATLLLVLAMLIMLAFTASAEEAQLSDISGTSEFGAIASDPEEILEPVETTVPVVTTKLDEDLIPQGQNPVVEPTVLVPEDSTAEKTALKALIDEAQVVLNELEGLMKEESIYEKIPLASFNAALTSAETVYNDAAATQDEVDAAANKLENTIAVVRAQTVLVTKWAKVSYAWAADTDGPYAEQLFSAMISTNSLISSKTATVAQIQAGIDKLDSVLRLINPPVPTTYTVTFIDTQNGSVIDEVEVEDGGLVEEPAAPTKVGYEFRGWFTSADGDVKWDFNTPITGNVTIFAQWEEIVVDDWIKVGTPDELLAFAAKVNGGEAAIKGKLTADIDMTGKTWTPIGNTQAKAFTGQFDGDGFTITLYIDGTANDQGLFGWAVNGALIKNVKIDGYLKIWTGGAILANTGNGSQGITIENCVNKATIVGGNLIGGIVGTITGYNAIIDCVNEGALSGPIVGGIIGRYSFTFPNSTPVTDCVNKGTITASGNAGGICATTTGPIKFSGCQNNAPITANSSAGGIIGNSTGGSGSISIEECFNHGAITSNYTAATLTTGAGGLVGSGAETGGIINISSSYNAGAVSGTACSVGGLVGYAHTTHNVTNSYSIGNVSSTSTQSVSYAGGITGYINTNAPTITNCYNAGAVTGATNLGSIACHVANLTNVGNSYYLAGTAAKGVDNQDDATGAVEVKSSTELKGLAPTLGSAYERGSAYPVLKWQNAGVLEPAIDTSALEALIVKANGYLELWTTPLVNNGVTIFEFELPNLVAAIAAAEAVVADPVSDETVTAAITALRIAVVNGFSETLLLLQDEINAFNPDNYDDPADVTSPYVGSKQFVVNHKNGYMGGRGAYYGGLSDELKFYAYENTAFNGDINTYKNIYNTWAGLITKTVIDTSALQAVIAEAEGYSADWFVTVYVKQLVDKTQFDEIVIVDTDGVFAAAIAAAKTTVAGATNQEEVDQAVTALQNAMVAALKNAMTQLNDVAKDRGSGNFATRPPIAPGRFWQYYYQQMYDNASPGGVAWNAFSAARSNVNTFVSYLSTYTQVIDFSGYYTKLIATMEALVPIDDVDRTEFRWMIGLGDKWQTAFDDYAITFKYGNETLGSYYLVNAKFMDALVPLCTYYFDTAVSNLKSGMQGLMYGSFKELVEKALAVTDTGYAAASWAVFEQALTDAKVEYDYMYEIIGGYPRGSNVYTIAQYEDKIYPLFVALGEAMAGLEDYDPTVPTLVDGWYQISTEEHLNWFANEVNGGNSAIKGKLAADIGASADYTPIGTNTPSVPFQGEFDGAGHTVTLSINNSLNYQGLFGYVSGAAIKNVTIDGAVSGGNYVGGVAGSANNSTITNCLNFATITGGEYTGGIAGFANGYLTTFTTISACINNGAVTGSYNVGGILGRTANSVKVSQCANTAAIISTGNDAASRGTGGVVGYMAGITVIDECYNSGKVEGSAYAAGGIAGATGGSSGVCTITNSYNIGAVKYAGSNSNRYAGGIIGVSASGDPVIESCYNAGAISNVSNNNVGGILGSGGAMTTINNNYYLLGTAAAGKSGVADQTGKLQVVTGTELKGLALTLGNAYKTSALYPILIWQDGGVDPIVYYTVTFNTQGGSEVAAVEVEEGTTLAKPAADPVKEGFIFKGWYTTADGNELFDFDTPITGDTTIYAQWEEIDENAPPLLDGWYLISTPEQLLWFAAKVNGGDTGIKGKVMNNIDASTVEYTPIGTQSTKFIGQFDGSEYTIKLDYTATGTGSLDQWNKGLIGYAGDGALIKNVTVDGSIIATGSYIGGVLGRADGHVTLENCVNKATVSGSGDIGGVIGGLASATISNCVNEGQVICTSTYAAGIIGFASGKVELTDCVNSGTVSGTGTTSNGIGGVIGDFNQNADNSTFTDCTNSGAISGAYNVGGIVGSARRPATISGCVNTGSITAAGDTSTTVYGVGGIVGFVPTTLVKVIVEDCDNSGAVEGSGPYIGVGGIVGTMFRGSSQISGSHNSGAVTYTGTLSTAYTGGIIGDSTCIDVTDCVNDGVISGAYRVGGVIGRAQSGTVKNCTNNGEVKGSNTVGGIFGSISQYTTGGAQALNVSACVNKGAVTSESSYVGGIVGDLRSTTDDLVVLEGFRNEGSVTSTSGNGYAGGIAGTMNLSSNGELRKCVNTGAVTSEYMAAGIVGIATYGTIEQCYNSGHITATGTSNSNVGGIVSYMSGIGPKVTNCYNIGLVENKSSAANANTGGIVASCGNAANMVQNCHNYGELDAAGGNIGGVIGNFTGTAVPVNVNNNYYLNTTAVQGVGNRDEAGMAGKTVAVTIAEMKKLAATLNDGVFKNGSYYPIFKWQDDEEPLPPIMEDGWYLIYDEDELLWFAGQVNIGNNAIKGKLMADIDLTGVAWTPIGTQDQAFIGQFNGGEHTITLDHHPTNNDYRDSYQGIFGYAGASAVIENVIADGSVSGWNYVGAVVGYANGTTVKNCVNNADITSRGYMGGVVGSASGVLIENCVNQADAKLSGGSNAGGVVGAVYGNTTVKNCTNKSDLTFAVSDNNIGGIVGYLASSGTGKVSGCLNSGNISAGYNVGGIAGQMLSSWTIEECGNSGAVTSITANYTGIYGTGGIAGGVSRATIVSCYNTGVISGNTINVGGIAGYLSDSSSSANNLIRNCYNRGNIIYTGTNIASRLGGIVGHSNSSYAYISSCYSSGDMSGVSNNKGGVIGFAGDYYIHDKLEKNYYLTGIAVKGIGGSVADAEGKVESVSTAQLRKLAPTLGNAYKEGSTYPILVWQDGETLYSDFTVVLEAGGPTDLNIGDTLSVNVMVYGEGLSFLDTEIRIPYDTSKLQYIGLNNTDSTVSTNEVENANGTVFFLTRHRPAVEISPDGFMLTTVSFKVIGSEAGSGSLTTGQCLVTVSGPQQEREALKGAPLEFTVHNLTVTFVAGNGVTMTEATAYVKYGVPGMYTDATYTTPFVIPTPSANSGYRLAVPVWSDGTSSYTNAEIEDMLFTANAVFTAEAVKVWSVSFLDAEGTLIEDSQNPQQVDDGNTAMALDDLQAPAGMSFAGWFVVESADAVYDGEAELYSKAEIDALPVTGDVLYKAYFTHNSYLLAYDDELVEILTGEEPVGYSTHGTDITFQLQEDALDDNYLYAVYYQIDDNERVLLTPNAGIYTIPGAKILGDVEITVFQLVKGTVTFIESDEYYGAPTGYKVALLHVDSPLASGSAFLYDGKLMYRTVKYDDGDIITAFFVENILDEMDVLAKITITDDEQTLVLYNGDVNRNGVVNSYDITMTYELYLEDGPYRVDPDFTLATMLSRLEADVTGDGTVDARDERAIQMLILGL